jgi:hypothetical protein
MKKTTTSPTPTRTEILQTKLATAFVQALSAIPARDCKRITEFWRALSVADAPADTTPMPRVSVIQQVRESDGEMPCRNILGGHLVFEAEFIQEAPQEVVTSAVLHLLAETLTRITGNSSENLVMQYHRNKQVIRKWKSPGYEIDFWLFAKFTFPQNPASGYYARRYSDYGVLPPASANLREITRLLKDLGHHSLAEKLLAMIKRPESATWPNAITVASPK